MTDWMTMRRVSAGGSPWSFLLFVGLALVVAGPVWAWVARDVD